MRFEREPGQRTQLSPRTEIGIGLFGVVVGGLFLIDEQELTGRSAVVLPAGAILLLVGLVRAGRHGLAGPPRPPELTIPRPHPGPCLAAGVVLVVFGLGMFDRGVGVTPFALLAMGAFFLAWGIRDLRRRRRRRRRRRGVGERPDDRAS